jgi:hypothetical protein
MTVGSPTTCGFASRDLTPDVGTPLAGYGGSPRRLSPAQVFGRRRLATLFAPSTGILDPIRAKAFVLEREGRRLLFLSLDIVGIPDDLLRAIVTGISTLGFGPDDVFVSATHTHSGPGALSRNLLWQVLAMDVGRSAVRSRFVAGVIDTVREARAGARPAVLSAVSFGAVGLQRNRRHVAGFYDPTANMLLARCPATGRWLGAMVNLAIHGTAMQADNLQLSADVPGGIERALEICLEAPVLFINGAVGDVSPVMSGTEGIALIGRRFADQAMAALPRARSIEADWSITTRLVRANPVLNPRSAALLERRNLNIGLGWLVPRKIPLSVVRLGDMVLLAWPGEPSTALGLAVKGAASDSGAAQAWVLGLTNGYLGYFVTPSEYRTGGYEAIKSLYGPDAGVRLVDEFRSMLGVA